MLIRLTAKVLLGAMLSTYALAGPVSQAPSVSSGQPAIWQSYDVLVHLIALPQRYSCDELWSKFRAVLIRVGAGRVDEITPEDCAGNSPSVHLRFILPRQDPNVAERSQDISAAMRTIEIGPDNPAQLQPSDCHLMQQIKQSLLSDLPLKIVTARFDCNRDAAGNEQHTYSAAAEAHQSYALSVRALMPVWPEQAAAGAVQKGG